VYDILNVIHKDERFALLPVILYTGKSLSQHEEKKIGQFSGEVVLRTADTFKKLSDDISFFLHLNENGDDKNRHVKPYIRENALGGKHVLIVDDDVRNIFSLTKLLESKKMVVSSAIDGNEAIAILDNDASVDLVLMDMMMPNKDGYETIIEIRNHPKLQKTKAIAVTAKAMSGDREKCIKAGANDYITKPVDTDQLVSLLKVWLYK
jgi:CheY-like chemotaxis protein